MEEYRSNNYFLLLNIAPAIPEIIPKTVLTATDIVAAFIKLLLINSSKLFFPLVWKFCRITGLLRTRSKFAYVKKKSEPKPIIKLIITVRMLLWTAYSKFPVCRMRRNPTRPATMIINGTVM